MIVIISFQIYLRQILLTSKTMNFNQDCYDKLVLSTDGPISDVLLHWTITIGKKTQSRPQRPFFLWSALRRQTLTEFDEKVHDSRTSGRLC